MIGSESIGFSGSQFRFVVETLNNAAGELAFGSEPVQQQRAVAPQLTGHFLHGLNLRSHRPGTPSVQELARPIGRFIGPEQLKLFLQQVAPDRLQIVAQKLRQPGLLLRRQILWPFKQQPAAISQHRLISLSLQLPSLLGTYLVDCLAQIRHDVKPIENMNRMARLFGNHLQVRFPHVAANITQLAATVLAQPAEEPQQGLHLPLLANPQQPPAVGVNLVNQRQILVPALPGDLIHADRFYPRQVLVGPTPSHRHLYRPEHMVPGRPKRPGHLFPAQPLGPARQKPGIGFGQLMFARCPRHSLYPNTTAPAAHPARGVDEEHLDTPHRDKLKAAQRQCVIAWPSAAAARADGPAIGPGAQLCLNRRFAGVFHPAHRAVHERFEILHAIQDSLEVHPVFLVLHDVRSHLHHYRTGEQDALLPVNPLFAESQPSLGCFLPTNFPEEP